MRFSLARLQGGRSAVGSRRLIDTVRAQRFMSSSTPTNSPPVVTFEEVHSIAKDPEAMAIIIDVRQPDEILSTGLIPNSHNIPRRLRVNMCV